MEDEGILSWKLRIICEKKEGRHVLAVKGCLYRKGFISMEELL